MKPDCRLSMRSLTQQAEKITMQYHNALIKQKLASAQLNEQTKKDCDYSYFIEAFELALKCLSPQLRMIIYNDFIQRQFVFWWEVQFARSTYYRHKYRALHQFVAFFQNQ